MVWICINSYKNAYSTKKKTAETLIRVISEWTSVAKGPVITVVRNLCMPLVEGDKANRAGVISRECRVGVERALYYSRWLSAWARELAMDMLRFHES